MQVWLGVGLSLFALALALTAVSGVYQRFIGYPSIQMRTNLIISRPRIISWSTLIYYTMFLFAHLANQGTSKKYILNYLCFMVICIIVYIIKDTPT